MRIVSVTRMTGRNATKHALRKARERLHGSRLALLDQMRQVRGIEQGGSGQDAQACMVAASAVPATAVRALPQSRLLALWRTQIHRQAFRKKGEMPRTG